LIFYYVLGFQLKNYTQFLMPLALFSSIIWLTPFIHPIQAASKNQIISNTYPVKFKYLLVPSKPFVSEFYEKRVFNGEQVFIPPNYHYAWDGPLPCVMRNHFEKYAK
jgi:hypothetical protein